MTLGKSLRAFIFLLVFVFANELEAQTGPWAKFNGTMKGQALVRDASGGYLSEVQSIVEGGGDVNWQLESGLSPLMGAASGGHLEIVKFLISKGADPSLADLSGRTALFYAKQGGANDVVKFLSNSKPSEIKEGKPDDQNSANPSVTPVSINEPIGPWAKFNGTMKGQALVRDASGGYLSEVQSIVEGGGDVNWQLESGLSPIMGAASGGYLEIVKFLISKGADPALEDLSGRTALFYAKQGGANDVVKYLSDPQTIGGVKKDQPIVPIVENKVIEPAINPLVETVNEPEANPIQVVKPAEVEPNKLVAARAVPWAPFGTYKVGAKVRFYAGSWKTGTIKELGTTGDRNQKNAGAMERKYLITTDGQYRWDESMDWGSVTGFDPETYWTGFFIGDWKLGEVMAMNTRADGNDQRDEYSFHSAVEILRVSADNKYQWKTIDGKEINGAWKAAEDGAGIILLNAYLGHNWTLRNETNAIEENIRGLETARLKADGQMSIKAQRKF